MDADSQHTGHPPNRLDGDDIPAEIKVIILEHISSHKDLVSLLEAYPIWVNALWKEYPHQLFPHALDNALDDIDQDVLAEVLFVYHIRKIRKDYATYMGSSVETLLHRHRLQFDLRDILSLDDDDFPAMEPNLQTILDVGRVVQDVNSLTYRYSNDAWRRIHDIERKTGERTETFAGLGSPEIDLQRDERLKLNRAFLRVEIYLLTKYWTNAQDQRHILHMGQDIEPYIPHPNIPDSNERREFDSCMRYIFHAYRGYLKKTAIETGAPELPTRDDFQWVPNRNEEQEYEYKDYPTLPKGNLETDFAQRSVSEEQGFLLWLCESGIGPLEQTHKADNSTRRGELLQQFSRRHIWETVELRHRVSRYDVSPDFEFSTFLYGRWVNKPRNRHPIMSLYGNDAHQQYSNTSVPWACASAFLEWRYLRCGPDRRPSRNYRIRGTVILDERGRWLTLTDTDKGASDWNAFQRKDRSPQRMPYGHPYMLSLEKYEMRWMPKRVRVMGP